MIVPYSGFIKIYKYLYINAWIFIELLNFAYTFLYLYTSYLLFTLSFSLFANRQMRILSTISATSSSTSSSHQHIHNAKKNRLKSLIKLEGILPSPSTNLKLDLVEPILFLRGIPQESVGCFLRGKLILNLNKPTKIKKIEMKFVGKIKTFWPEGKVHAGMLLLTILTYLWFFSFYE